VKDTVCGRLQSGETEQDCKAVLVGERCTGAVTRSSGIVRGNAYAGRRKWEKMEEVDGVGESRRMMMRNGKEGGWWAIQSKRLYGGTQSSSEHSSQSSPVLKALASSPQSLRTVQSHQGTEFSGLAAVRRGIASLIY